jgi:hypothetical protein
VSGAGGAPPAPAWDKATPDEIRAQLDEFVARGYDRGTITFRGKEAVIGVPRHLIEALPAVAAVAAEGRPGRWRVHPVDTPEEDE